MTDVGWVALGTLELQIRMALINAEVVKREATEQSERNKAGLMVLCLADAAVWLEDLRDTV